MRQEHEDGFRLPCALQCQSIKAIQLRSVSGGSREEWVFCFCGAGRDSQPALAWQRRQALPAACICVYDFLKENPVSVGSGGREGSLEGVRGSQ